MTCLAEEALSRIMKEQHRELSETKSIGRSWKSRYAILSLAVRNSFILWGLWVVLLHLFLLFFFSFSSEWRVCWINVRVWWMRRWWKVQVEAGRLSGLMKIDKSVLTQIRFTRA